MYVRLLLRKEGINFRTTAEFETVRTIKEKACYLANNPLKEESVDTEHLAYTLPDGNTIQIGPARFRAPEVLFRPDLIGEECQGLHEVLVFSIQKSDLDLRKVLSKNIVLSGGSTLFKVGNSIICWWRCFKKPPRKRMFTCPKLEKGCNIISCLLFFRALEIAYCMKLKRSCRKMYR